tara:strand:- start:18 stop:674 length:657 start_codon:yes stop_codon:yes gene_type:complete
MGRFSLGIVIPARNEEKTIKKVIDSIKKYGDILVVDDASSDKTLSILKKSKIKYLRNYSGKGYEETVIKGIKYLLKKNYKYIATFDADGEHDHKFFLKLKNITSFDLIIGQRKSFNRLSEYLFSFITHLLFNIKDPLSGLKIYNTKILKKIKIKNENILNTSIIFKIKFLGGKVIHKLLKVKKRKDQSRLGNNLIVNINIIYYILKLLVKLLFLKAKI